MHWLQEQIDVQIQTMGFQLYSFLCNDGFTNENHWQIENEWIECVIPIDDACFLQLVEEIP